MDGGQMDAYVRLITSLVPQRFQPFFAAYREKLLYLFFGGLSFLLSVGSYAMFLYFFSFCELTATPLSWLLTTAFVFASNRRWVFGTKPKHGAELRRQVFAFYAGRLSTLFVEEAVIAVFVTWLGFPGVLVKIFAQFIVILLNYFFSKKFIFIDQS